MSKREYSTGDLQKLDLTSKYDDDIASPDGISMANHMLLYIIGLFFAIFIIWANLAELDEVTRGEAKVIPSSEVQVIQNLEGGIIDAFLVEEGQRVEKDQILLRIRNVQAKADLRANEQRYLGTRATVIRLQAEAEDKPLEFPEELTKKVPESVASELDAYNANKKEYDTQKRIIEQQLAQKEQEVAELKRRISDLYRVIKLAKDEKEMIERMVARGAAPKIEILQLDRQIAEKQAELNGLRLALPRTESAVKEAEERLKEHDNTFRANAQRELAAKIVEMNTIRETLAAHEDREMRTEVRSPVRGTVKDMKVKTVGAVVQPGEAIMEVVPLEDRLVVEANVRPSDIAFIHPGQEATVKITAYDFSIYGGLEGVVDDISADTITNEEGESFYRVKIVTEETALLNDGKTHTIIPGMTASVDILTGKKTVMHYLLKPLTKASQVAMRER